MADFAVYWLSRLEFPPRAGPLTASALHEAAWRETPAEACSEADVPAARPQMSHSGAVGI
jgi:hypothetical protein